ncbi:MAG: tetratricopeptide repeat protein [Deinococcales bacterium]
MQLLGREKRRAYRTFVGGVRSEHYPKLLITGRPGSGKTLLTDYIQQALEMPPKAAERIIRLEFSRNDLAASLSRLAHAVGVPGEFLESRFAKIAASSAYAVQADAQADVARTILENLRHHQESIVLLLHISQVVNLGDQEDSLGLAPLRLNTPEVPRVNSTEWLWLSLLTPMSRLSNVSILVSMVDVPARVMASLGKFEGPIKLSPPTASEARRFVKARLPHFPSAQQETLVHRAKRSFEDLRTLTLLAEIREPLGAKDLDDSASGSRHVNHLSHLVHTAADEGLRRFLGALAVLSLPEFAAFSQRILAEVSGSESSLSSIEQAFLDVVPGKIGVWRCFSRQLAHSLREELFLSDPKRYRDLNAKAAKSYQSSAQAEPRGEVATRYVHHLLEARNWQGLEQWLSHHSVQQSLLRRIWKLASQEIAEQEVFEAITLQVAAYYVKLGSHNHPDVMAGLDVLSNSKKADLRAWAQLKRAESEVIKGNYDQAEKLVQDWPLTNNPTLNAEVTLVKASVARWRGQLDKAADYIAEGARSKLSVISPKSVSGELVHAKVSVWSGLIAKDRGELLEALEHFSAIDAEDDLIMARVAFQKGDVLTKIGRYDEALISLKRAFDLSIYAEAPIHEQVRYQSRLAHLLRRRGELSESEYHFEAASKRLDNEQIIEGERDFEKAKISDERALCLLGRGHFSEAIFSLQHNILIFEKYQSVHEVDASFRIARSTLRLSLAYWCRSIGQVYTFPLMRALDTSFEHPDVKHGQKLAKKLNRWLEQAGAYRYGSVFGQSLLNSSLLAVSPEESLDYADKALAWARFDYQKAHSSAYKALAYLRQADADKAIATVKEGMRSLEACLKPLPYQKLDALSERGDMGLMTWLLGLEMQAHALQQDLVSALASLDRAVAASHLALHQEAVLRAFGELIEQRPQWLKEKKLLAKSDTVAGLEHLNQSSVRLADALIAYWQRAKNL